MVGVSLAEHRNDDPHERALHDPDFLDAVRANHRGRWNVFDALWWAAHPDDAAPSGTPAPALRVRALQRRLFAADADAAGDQVVAGLLRELEAEIVAERAFILEAVAAADAGRPAGGDLDPIEQDDEPMLGTGPPGPDRTAGFGARGRRAVVLLTAALAAATLLGVILGAGLTGGNLDGQVAATPTATATATGEPNVTALEIFDRTREPEDDPGILLPGQFEADSVRLISNLASPGTGTSVAYYAARSSSNLICLIVVMQDSDYLSTCTLAQDFPATGLRLYWKQLGIGPFADDGVAAAVDAYVTWYPDGGSEAGMAPG